MSFILSTVFTALVGAAMIVWAFVPIPNIPPPNHKQKQLALVGGLILLIVATFLPMAMILVSE